MIIEAIVIRFDKVKGKNSDFAPLENNFEMGVLKKRRARNVLK